MAKWCRKANLAYGAGGTLLLPALYLLPQFRENRYSAFPELLQRSRRDVLERGSRLEARSDPGLFFW
ncbi:hypothetical protein EB233_05340 [Mesorhizobium erdmanii]|uniref:Uncharacterized protein n=1 Tax=Mesorhizobium erdmanii TaxID=1777866 RepID=A0A6M7UBC7_9HYPH|nr:hypothetical protein EB233_05340 [Mesorhizobium erdmanii]